MVTRSSLNRIRVLLTGNVKWVDNEGNVEPEHLSLRNRWSIFGVHSYNWKWVRRTGKKSCGCTFNPITHRKVLTRLDCPEHGRPLFKDVEDWHGKAAGNT